MPESAAVAMAQLEPTATKPGINPDAYYTYAELEALKIGKYLKWRRAILAGKIIANYAGRNCLIKGSEVLRFIGA